MGLFLSCVFPSCTEIRTCIRSLGSRRRAKGGKGQEQLGGFRVCPLSAIPTKDQREIASARERLTPWKLACSGLSNWLLEFLECSLLGSKCVSCTRGYYCAGGPRATATRLACPGGYTTFGRGSAARLGQLKLRLLESGWSIEMYDIGLVAIACLSS